MKFTMTPESLLALLNQVSTGLTKRLRENMQVTFSSARKRVSVIGNGIIAGVSTQVIGQGQFQINWKTITELLTTFSPQTPLCFDCRGNRLQIGSFCTSVENYQSKPVPVKQSIPPAIQFKQSASNNTQDDPQRKASPDGYSPPPPYRDDNDVTGVAGMVSAADFTGPREPVTCPVCKHVGYYVKNKYSGGTYYSYRRSWVTARDALDRVVLTGMEESLLCPDCLALRSHTAKHITPIIGSQADLFDQR